MIRPWFPPAGRQLSGPTFEPRSVTIILDELTGAPSVISVVLPGQTRSDA
jgi:hypothetical protein